MPVANYWPRGEAPGIRAARPNGRLLRGSVEAEQHRLASVRARRLTDARWFMFNYRRPGIILGRSQRPDATQLARARRLGLSLVGRKSGGGAVMANRGMLSLNAVFPPWHPVARGSPAAAFRNTGRLWQAVLAELGIDSRMVDSDTARESRQRASRQDLDWACHASLSHGELVTPDGRKLLGAAQVRSGGSAVLSTGIYLSPPDWSSLCTVMRGHAGQADCLGQSNTDLGTLTGLVPDRLERALVRHFAAAWQRQWLSAAPCEKLIDEDRIHE